MCVRARVWVKTDEKSSYFYQQWPPRYHSTSGIVRKTRGQRTVVRTSKPQAIGLIPTQAGSYPKLGLP